MLRSLFKAGPMTVFEATGITRTIRVTDDGFMTVTVRRWAWWAMSERRKEGRQPAVGFPLVSIRSGWYRPARWYRPGALVLDVPHADDPWRRRTDRQRRKKTYPKTRPHRIRFTLRHQPDFEQCAVEIGMATTD